MDVNRCRDLTCQMCEYKYLEKITLFWLLISMMPEHMDEFQVMFAKSHKKIKGFCVRTINYKICMFKEFCNDQTARCVLNFIQFSGYLHTSCYF